MPVLDENVHCLRLTTETKNDPYSWILDGRLVIKRLVKNVRLYLCIVWSHTAVCKTKAVLTCYSFFLVFGFFRCKVCDHFLGQCPGWSMKAVRIFPFFCVLRLSTCCVSELRCQLAIYTFGYCRSESLGVWQLRFHSVICFHDE